MDWKELQFWLGWNRVPGVGATRFYKLLQAFGSMEEAWSGSTAELTAVIGAKAVGGLEKLKASDWDGEQELEHLQRYGFKVFCQVDAAYPPNLKKIPDPPPVLYCWGTLEYGDDLAVALVGTRNPSPLGICHARDLSAQLIRQGFTVVSGMARGIDTAAHYGALEAGGRTLAVLGCGLDVVYPPENKELMRQIAGQGAVLTQYPLGTRPLAANFPARNRIISGLSLGVAVIEATEDSGSLITADFALEQGREVFAMPGTIENEGSKGPHKLIRQGAKLIESYRDILEELALPQQSPEETGPTCVIGLSDLEAKIYAVLNREPAHINQIQRQSGLSAAQVNQGLTQLELKGVAKRFPGQLYLKVQ